MCMQLCHTLKTTDFALPGKEMKPYTFIWLLIGMCGKASVWFRLTFLSYEEFLETLTWKSKNLTFCIRFDFPTFDSARNSVLHLRASAHILCLISQPLPILLNNGQVPGWGEGYSMVLLFVPLNLLASCLLGSFLSYTLNPSPLTSVCAHVGDQELMSP